MGVAFGAAFFSSFKVGAGVGVFADSVDFFSVVFSGDFTAPDVGCGVALGVGDTVVEDFGWWTAEASGFAVDG